MVLLLLSLLILFNFAGEDKIFWVRYMCWSLIDLIVRFVYNYDGVN